MRVAHQVALGEGCPHSSVLARFARSALPVSPKRMLGLPKRSPARAWGSDPLRYGKGSKPAPWHRSRKGPREPREASPPRHTSFERSDAVRPRTKELLGRAPSECCPHSSALRAAGLQMHARAAKAQPCACVGETPLRYGKGSNLAPWHRAGRVHVGPREASPPRHTSLSERSDAVRVRAPRSSWAERRADQHSALGPSAERVLPPLVGARTLRGRRANPVGDGKGSKPAPWHRSRKGPLELAKRAPLATPHSSEATQCASAHQGALGPSAERTNTALLGRAPSGPTEPQNDSAPRREPLRAVGR